MAFFGPFRSFRASSARSSAFQVAFSRHQTRQRAALWSAAGLGIAAGTYYSVSRSTHASSRKEIQQPGALLTSVYSAIPSTSFVAASPREGSEDKHDSTEQNHEQTDSSGGGGGAFDPETGEINWDCPCLGGMAHGPCGPEFREAFSCFVYSEQEPKGIECVEKFRGMQDCFRRHPEVYAEELAGSEDDDIDSEHGKHDSSDIDSSSGGSGVRPKDTGGINPPKPGLEPSPPSDDAVPPSSPPPFPPAEPPSTVLDPGTGSTLPHPAPLRSSRSS